MRNYFNDFVGNIKVVANKEWGSGLVKLGFVLEHENGKRSYIKPDGTLQEIRENTTYDSQDLPWFVLSESLVGEMIKTLQEIGVQAADKQAYEVKVVLLEQQLKLKDDVIAVQEKRIDDLKDEINHYNRKPKTFGGRA